MRDQLSSTNLCRTTVEAAVELQSDQMLKRAVAAVHDKSVELLIKSRDEIIASLAEQDTEDVTE